MQFHTIRLLLALAITLAVVTPASAQINSSGTGIRSTTKTGWNASPGRTLAITPACRSLPRRASGPIPGRRRC